jgi:MFS transporter, DHA1 family, multidrug resistance protein
MNNRMFISLFITITATALGASQVLPLLPIYAQTMGATGLELGLIFSSFALARSLVLPAVGSLSDRWGRRHFMLWGLFSYIIIALGFSVATNVYHLILCRLIQGAGAAMVIPVARAYFGDMSAPGQEGRYMGLFNMAFFGGLALGPWMGGLLKDHFGINISFYSMAVLALLGLILSWITLPVHTVDKSAQPKPQISYLTMLHEPPLLAIFLIRFGSIIGVGMNWTFLPLYAHEHIHLSSSRIGILISLTVIMTTLLQPTFGRMADRVNRTWMTFWGGMIASLCLLAIPFCHSFHQLFVLNLLFGSALGLYMPPLMAIAVEEGRKLGFMMKVMSLLEMSFSFGMVVGPLTAGFIKEAVNLKSVFWVGGIIGVVSCLLFLVMMPARPERPPGN